MRQTYSHVPWECCCDNFYRELPCSRVAQFSIRCLRWANGGANGNLLSREVLFLKRSFFSLLWISIQLTLFRTSMTCRG